MSNNKETDTSHTDTSSDISEVYTYINLVKALLGNNEYIRKQCVSFFGVDIIGEIYDYTLTEDINEKSYELLKNAHKNSSIVIFFESLDIAQICLSGNHEEKLSAQDLLDIATNIDMNLELSLNKFAILETVLPARFTTIASNEEFEIIYNGIEREGIEYYYLIIGGKKYYHKELYGSFNKSDNNYFFSFVTFTHDNISYVFDFQTNKLLEFEGEIIDSTKILGKNYIVIISPHKSIVYCLEDGFEFEKNMDIEELIGFGDDVLIIGRYREIRYIGSDITRTTSYTGLFFKNDADNEIELEGNISERHCDSSSGILITLERNESHISEKGLEVSASKHLYHLPEKKDTEIVYKLSQGVTIPQQKTLYGQKYKKNHDDTLNEEVTPENIKFKTFPVQDDFILIMSYPKGFKNDNGTRIYQIKSLSGNTQIDFIRKISKVTYENKILEIEYYTDNYIKKYYNSSYDYDEKTLEVTNLH